jgi:enoyl-CoA hydratase/3-hydroxyacyl-CoA dehydrogenase
MKNIKTVGVVGAGTMGSALAQKFAQEDFDVILCDKELRFIDAGIERIKNTLKEGVDKKIFSLNQTENILNKISGSLELVHLKKCDIIIEAIYENFDAKVLLFKELGKIVGQDTIIATNTSSYSVNELSEYITNPGRFLGLHFFYHAAKNRLVEIIPGNKTSQDVLRSVNQFAALSGKDPIMCKDSYGFVVNRFFVPWLNEAARLYEEGVASKGEIDSVCMKTFSISMGPFALMNATGVPIAYHAEKTLEVFGNLYKTSNLLKEQTDFNQNWVIEEVNWENINVDARTKISERMLGIVFLVCSQILDEKICPAEEINRGARIGLRWRKGPVDLMKKIGQDEVIRLIKILTNKYEVTFPVSVYEVNWEMEYVKLVKSNDTALITMSRPEDMNSLNEDVIQQLSEKFELADTDKNIKKIILTGSGKAFVAGADIKFFIDNIRSNSINNIVAFTKFGQKVFDKIDKSTKTVISIVNGLALGGGFELALCSDIILACPKAVFAFPETGIGIYPGLGGTQRTQKRIGTGLAKYLIYTGEFINADEAKKIGLVDDIIQLNDIPDIIEGTKRLPSVHADKISLDEKYRTISEFFDKYSLSDIGGSDHLLDSSSNFINEKLLGKIKKKAPLALKTAEKLINEAKGCESELSELTNIFSTSDALQGLSSIGKKVKFQGT